jgi:hypothetical protein
MTTRNRPQFGDAARRSRFAGRCRGANWATLRDYRLALDGVCNAEFL